MPRRPRPTHTKELKMRIKSEFPGTDHLSSKNALAKTDDEDSGEYSNEWNDQDSDYTENEIEDADAPRVFQWADEESGVEGEEEEPTQLKSLQNNLSSLPLGALRRAQRVLQHAEAVTDSEESLVTEDGGNEDADQFHKSVEWSLKPKGHISKRANKHAPVEVTSKRPVSRKRTVVEVKTVQSRDPRFLPMAGEFSAEKFQKNYNFLAETHKSELATLRENLKRGRKLLASSPRDQLYEREQEVHRLELAVKRAESMVNKDRSDKVAREALSKLSKEEKDKRKQGKGGWWLKEAEKRNLLMKARYEALAAEGGKRAVKKVIEKKQKKASQKDKRSRPFPNQSFVTEADSSRKRIFDDPHGSQEGGKMKRRKLGST